MLKLSLKRYTEINKMIDQWHNEEMSSEPLYKLLSLSEEEYADFVKGNFEIEYDHDYKIEIKFEDATMRRQFYDPNTGITSIYPGFPSMCKLSILSKSKIVFNFESIGFNFGCLGALTKPDIINWFESGYNADYSKFIKFKLTSMEYPI